ncbi:MAG TPA: PilZ domain-containing protein [Steroidobacteraceae bacterium]|nr:PilZ domain-containing protein [Steroidobacteraceae bacterium]
MTDGVDTVVLYNELAYHDVLPVEWQARKRALTRFEQSNLEEANLMLLQACAAVEEHPIRDQGEDPGPLAGEIARLDFKLNLVLQLLSKLVLKDRMPPSTTIQFNALGASWTAIGPAPEVGSHGLLRVHLRGSLPQPLDLPAVVSGVEGAQVRVRFEELPDAVGELIQRLAFLRHRRDVADARKARPPAEEPQG